MIKENFLMICVSGKFYWPAPIKIVGDIIDNRFITLNVNDDQEVANQVFKMNNRVALPVVDDKNILLGIVTIDDMLWVANEEFSEDMQKMGGTEAWMNPIWKYRCSSFSRKEWFG